MSQNSVVGTATGYGSDDRRVGVRVPVGSRIFLLQVVQTRSGVHPASYPMGIGLYDGYRPIPVGKATGT
jgi:hypothetical protein